jgi:acyl-coenzyme A thioesterase PaaI-like protein
MSKQGFIRAFSPGPRLMRWMFNIWPPFLGMGIHVTEIAPDFRRVKVRLRMGMLNRNYVGTHFGGSLFAMTDPYYMIMMSHNLGRDYIVWDKAATIRFRAPGKGTVKAEFEVTQAMVDEAIAATARGGRFEPTYLVQVKDSAGKLVAEVEKTLHIRRADAVRRPANIAAAKAAE